MPGYAMTFADALSPAAILVHAAIIIFAALVHGTIGIGFPMIATPLLAMVGDVRSAILLLVLPTMTINVANIVKGGRWGRSIALYWPLAAYGVVGSFIGTRLLVDFSPEPFRPLMAAMLALYLNAGRLGVGFAWVRRHPRLAFACFGLAGGILAGTVNVMLPVLIIYALEVKMPKTVMIQVFNFCFLMGKLTQGAVLVQADLMTMDLFKASLAMAGLGLTVMLAGMRIRDRIPTDAYRRWLRRLLVLMAVVLLVQYVAAP
ncbi:MAG TPA: sulfite exporter TauE/SafE family protein [Desulfosarcina sp.]|nr:sulfite exporter TauE/SafE family protein [Desulfosarcina sp.]